MNQELMTFDAIDEILAKLCPEHASSKKAVTLEADAPIMMRRLWDATGVSEATGRLLTRAESEDKLSEIFRRWLVAPVNRAGWGPDEALLRRGLPDRIRLVQFYSDRVFVTDETTSEADPPVLVMRARKSPLIRYCDRYSEWQIWEDLSGAASVRQTAYIPSGPIDGQPILKELYPPGLYAMTEKIWWLRMPDLSKEADQPVLPNPVIFVSARAYLEFLFGLPEERMGLFWLPESSVIEVARPGPLNFVLKGPPDGFRMARRSGGQGPTDWFQAVGPIGDTFVWMLMRKELLMVGFDPGARDEVRAWLTGQGVKVTRETPLPPPTRGSDGWRIPGPPTTEVPPPAKSSPVPKASRRKKGTVAQEAATVESDSPFAIAVAGEAGRIATLLAKNTTEPRQSVNLPESDPPTVRAFWRAVGWNDKWPSQFHLHHPDVEQSVRELPQVLAQLKDESPKSPALKRGGLPKKFRIADVDRDGVGFRVTKEDDPEHREDPKMIGVIFESGAVFEEPNSYLKTCADELISVAFSSWHTEFVGPSELPAAAGETPFPTLSPTTRMLAENVWLLPAHPEARPSADRAIAYATAAEFTRVFVRPPKRRHGG